MSSVYVKLTVVGSGLLHLGVRTSTGSSAVGIRQEDQESHIGRSHSFVAWVLGALFVYLLSLLAGVYQFDGKWTHVTVPGWFFTKYDGDPPVVVDCAKDPYTFKPPCYLGLQQEVTEISLWVCVLPFAPLFIAVMSVLAAIYSSGEAYKAGQAAWARLISYVLLFVLFYTTYYSKCYIQAALDTTVDPSDHVTVSMVGLTIAFTELGVNHGHHWIWWWLVLLAAVLVLSLKAYFSYFTARYFHSPQETGLGFVEGLAICLFYLFLMCRFREKDFCPNHKQPQEAQSGPYSAQAPPTPEEPNAQGDSGQGTRPGPPLATTPNKMEQLQEPFLWP